MGPTSRSTAVRLMVLWLCSVARGSTESNKLALSAESPLAPVEGSRVDVNCTVIDGTPPLRITWMTPQGEEARIQQYLNNVTSQLTILKLNRSDAGIYTCELDAHGRVMQRKLTLHVTPADSASQICSHTKFRCASSGHCIFLRFRCDGVSNCRDGSDELDCDGQQCKIGYRCNNSMCISKSLWCNGKDDCGDDSDEQDCQNNGMSQTTVTMIVEEVAHFNWLKTTVYTVIGCTVAVVIFISFIVIVVFRVKMKRLRARRFARVQERQRRYTDSNGSGRAPEQDPFLQIGTNSHYGNIIVNVNNGVQYMPGGDFVAFMDSPPPYSEVMERGQREESPPPPYSTWDKHTREAAGQPKTTSDGASTSQAESPARNAAAESASAEPVPSTSTADLPVLPEMAEEAGLEASGGRDAAPPPPPTDPPSPSAPLDPSLVTGPLNSEPDITGESSTSGSEQAQGGATSTLPGPRPGVGGRKGQLTVQGGKILICGGGGPSGEAPEGGERGWTRQGQLQVQGGQIVLRVEDGDAEQGGEQSPIPQTARGELEVQEGQIVLRLREH